MKGCHPNDTDKIQQMSKIKEEKRDKMTKKKRERKK